jgi:hypothetical protein
MIRKPPANWSRPKDGAAIRTVRTASAVAVGGARVARCSWHAARGVICFCFAALWGFAAIASGLGGNLPMLIFVGTLAAFMFWLGRRAFAKARGALA